jgi:hypothetical protein
MSNPLQREFDHHGHERFLSNPYAPGDLVFTPYAIERALVVRVDDCSVWVKTGHLEKCRVLLDLVGI